MRSSRSRLTEITTIKELRAVMTDQQNRHGDGDIGPPSLVKSAPSFVNYRIVDPVRKAALECATHLITTSPMRPDESDTARATRVLHIAVMLDQYLTGEGANGPTNP